MRFSKAIALIALSILLAVLPAPAQRQKGRTAKPPKAPIVVEAIDLDALKTLLSQQRPHPLLINFWATYCDPCRDEFPDLVKIDKDYRPPLDFVTISLDDVSEIKTEVPKFLGSMKATMPAYLLNVSDPDPAIELVDKGWQGSLPATFLYNEKGEMVYKHIGRVNPEELRAAIDKVIKKEPKSATGQ